MLHWKLIAAGAPTLTYAKLGLEEYAGRLKHYARIELCFLRVSKNRVLGAAEYRKHTDQGVVVVMDERGAAWDTTEFVARIGEWERRNPKRINVLIGPSDGHDPLIREEADHVVALSAFTMQHELALVVLVEQMYRAHTVLRGEPYHRV